MSLQVALDRIQEAKETNATELDLSSLELTEIPPEVSKLTRLTKLNLDDNQIKEIRNLEKLKKLSDLNIMSNQITEIKNLEKLTRLESLALNHNNIKEIKGLEKLKALESLQLYLNQITEIKGLEKLISLTVLDLGRNKITEIKNLEAHTKLWSLRIDQNQITEITGIDTLTRLRVLDLSKNKITEIKGIATLTNLLELNIEDNNIKTLPQSILDFNLDITTSGVHKENYISLGNNPFTMPPYDIVANGNEAVREYYKQHKKGDELLLEAKLILLGDGRSGKTSLANRLLGKELPAEEDRTQGVDIIIGAYTFPTANGSTFKLNIWDFAGQDKYKTLHQLFYTESSLYVMVAESGNNTIDYNDWFQAAALFGEGSPLLLVLNEFKTGIGMGSFDKTYWKKQFPELLKEVFTSNLKTKANFPIVEEHIQLLAQTLPHTKYTFPSNWAAVRRVLNERRNEQYISLKEYLQICKDNKLPERESALILSSVLHKIGDCLHYQKSELLRQIIILKNEWATEAVYKILDDKEVAEDKCGFFTEEDARRIWNHEDYIDMIPQLLELMQQFKLAYQLPGKQEYVTPPLLPLARPDRFIWPELDSLELYIEYEFLPKALLTQFIVSRHTDIAEERTLVWRHGVILQWEGKALSEVSKTKLHGKDAIYIRTQGTDRKGMMTVILNTFRELHQEYKGIKYDEKVPCTCDGCTKKQNKQHYYDFEHLNLRLERGRHKVECDKSLLEINVLELLENTFVLEKREEGRAIHLKKDIEEENINKIRVIKLFLASSNELKSERDKIEKALGRKNDLLRNQGFKVALSIWEDAKSVGKSVRSQDNYNLEIETCNLFTMLFYSKVGKYSLEEFELANSLFDKEKMPRLCVFQKDVDLPKNQSKRDSISRFDFIDKMTELEHFPILYKNEDQFVNQLKDIIDKLLLDTSFVDMLGFE